MKTPQLEALKGMTPLGFKEPKTPKMFCRQAGCGQKAVEVVEGIPFCSSDAQSYKDYLKKSSIEVKS